MLDFISVLKKNNRRDWFLEHKAEYESIRNECFHETDDLINKIACFDRSLSGITAKDCTYRIYRDIRFSLDKTPYKTHFGIVLGKGGRKCKQAGYYLHIEPGECALYGGVWFPEQPVLNYLRHTIDDNIDEFIEILHSEPFQTKFPSLVGDSLKTLPKGFPRDCPHGDILKRKEFLVMKTLPDPLFSKETWQTDIVADIETMKPFIDFLNFAFEEMHTR